MMKGDGIVDRKLREALETLAGFRKSAKGRALTEAVLDEVNVKIAEAKKSVVAAERRIAALNSTLAAVQAAVSDLNLIQPSDFAKAQHQHEQKDVKGLVEALAELGKAVSSGSGANGSFLRFDGGLQVCWITGVTFSYADANHLSYSWTYPAAFKSGTVPFRSVAYSNSISDLTGVTIQQMGPIRLGAGHTSAPTRIARAQDAASFVSGNQVDNCQVFAFGAWE